VVGGEVVDFFVGALPEREIRERIERMLRSGEITRIRDLEATAPEEAEAAYRQMLEKSPGEATASIGLARVLLDQGQVDEARAILDRLESRGFLEPEAETLKASLQLAGKKEVDLAACRQAAEEHPEDLELQLSLAEALAADGQYQAAMDVCLQLVERDRQGAGEQARQVMLDIFRVLPKGSELVPEYRRKLSMLLY
jgi:putative thioredoxin